MEVGQFMHLAPFHHYTVDSWVEIELCLPQMSSKKTMFLSLEVPTPGALLMPIVVLEVATPLRVVTLQNMALRFLSARGLAQLGGFIRRCSTTADKSREVFVDRLGNDLKGMLVANVKFLLMSGRNCCGDHESVACEECTWPNHVKAVY